MKDIINRREQTNSAKAERGAAMIEYGILLSVFVMVILTALPAFNYAVAGADANLANKARLFQSYPRPLL